MSTILDRDIDIGEFRAEPDDDLIICRCEEVTKGEIRRAVHEGMRTMTEVRRFLRTGMGLCQGSTCEKLVRNIIAKEMKVRPADLGTWTSRSPARPIEMRTFGNEVTD